MSSRIKGPEHKNKLTAPPEKLDYPVFCFKHLTTNKRFNINKFGNKSREKQKAYGALFYLIEQMQNKTWLDLYNIGKSKGFETIPSNQLNFKPKGLELTPDTKVLVIRFKRGSYRMIGAKSEVNKDVFHVYGFDFDYSAYNHG